MFKLTQPLRPIVMSVTDKYTLIGKLCLSNDMTSPGWQCGSAISSTPRYQYQQGTSTPLQNKLLMHHM